jgi:hypothetical protein
MIDHAMTDSSSFSIVLVLAGGTVDLFALLMVDFLIPRLAPIFPV